MAETTVGLNPPDTARDATHNAAHGTPRGTSHGSVGDAAHGAVRGTAHSDTPFPVAPRASLWAASRAVLRGAWRSPGLTLAVLVLALVLAWAFVPTVFCAHAPLATTPDRALLPPSGAAWFGTDYLGRDVWSRVVHASSLSLRAPVIAVGLALAGGVTIGLVAGSLRGWVDALLMRMVDTVLAVPAIILSLTVVTALGPGTAHAAIAVGLAGIAGFSRIVRAQVLRARQEPYVEAASAAGVRGPVVLLTHVLPHVCGPVLALAALELGTAVLAVSALSFLGLGAQPPTPEWGAMVSEGRDYLGTAWWLTVLPGLTIAAVTVAVNRIARALSPGGRP
ncbi:MULTISPECIES: ABC transporter permease [unclassified Frankia]|uniref:ABC transporter permease n=1 Tax=unclassified Frankia TaxID=2632575 RepID=UPI0020255FAF